jgi:ubiquinol-cytochrome c reductase cytochrome c subunit
MPRFVPLEEWFEGRHFDQEIIVPRARWYLSFKFSYRDRVIVTAEQGTELAHATTERCSNNMIGQHHRRVKQRLRAMSIRSILRVLLLVPLASGFGFGQDPEVEPSPNGQAIFLQHCAKCHGEKGEGINAVVTIAGPNLQAEHNTGSAMTAMETGPSHMPSFVYVLSVPEMRAAADYVVNQLAVIPLTGGSPSEGGTLFRVYCATCHQTGARGGALAFTGINAPALTGKSAAIIAGAVRWGPGPMPAFPPSILTDKQLNSIVTYVEFIQHPPSPGGSPLNWYGPVAEGFAAWVIVFALVVITGWIEKGGKG